MFVKCLSNCAPAYVHNAGDRRECALALHMGQKWEHHDSKPYHIASDVEAGDMHISVKASAFTLMSGTMTEGRDNLEDILALYMERTHSNTVAYIAADFTAYLMNMVEFTKFVRTFCYVERDSEKNGGGYKVRCRKESGKMLRWLANMAA